jgi:uncharacterized protein (DUF1697 family)
MRPLVDTCEELGYGSVRTHGNSGNIVFDTTGSRLAIEQEMERALERTFGFEKHWAFISARTRLNRRLETECARRAQPVPRINIP